MLKRTALTDTIHYASLMEVSDLIARGDLSPVALTEIMLDRISALNPKLNAYLLVTGEGAWAEAAAAEAIAKEYRPKYGQLSRGQSRSGHSIGDAVRASRRNSRNGIFWCHASH